MWNRQNRLWRCHFNNSNSNKVDTLTSSTIFNFVNHFLKGYSIPRLEKGGDHALQLTRLCIPARPADRVEIIFRSSGFRRWHISLSCSWGEKRRSPPSLPFLPHGEPEWDGGSLPPSWYTELLHFSCSGQAHWERGFRAPSALKPLCHTLCSVWVLTPSQSGRLTQSAEQHDNHSCVYV